MTPVRHFLAIPDLTPAELLGLMELATKMKAGTYPEKPLAGKTLGMIFAKSSTRTRVSFEVGVPVGRPRPLPVLARHPARPGRADPGYCASALALPRRHHDPHVRSRRRRGAGPLRHDPRDQRTHRPAASLPGTRRPSYRQGESGRVERQGDCLDRRRQQHGQQLAQCRRHPGVRAAARLPEGIRAERRDPRAQPCEDPGDPHHRSARSGARRARGQHRCVGVDGAGAGAGDAGACLRGLYRRSGADALADPGRSFSTVSPPTAAKRLRTRSSRVRSHGCGTRPKIGCTCRRR